MSMSKRLILVSLESVPSRYTYFWKTHLPKVLKENTGLEVVEIGGPTSSMEATPGAFLNFSGTNAFKSHQAIEIADMFNRGEVGKGDVFLFTDAWNPVILMVRYMIDLLDVNAKIASIWHAGSYDPADFLGRKIDDKNWSYNAERSFFYASDLNFFATNFHIEMMTSTLGIPDDHPSIVRTGFPMEYIKDTCYSSEKEDIICFPHRLSVEKNYELFKEIEKRLPQYKFIACQESALSKKAYYNILSRSKILFSANTQETLGIGTFEGLASGAVPYVPDALSYKEMYSDEYRYSPEFLNSVEYHTGELVKIMESYDEIKGKLEEEAEKVYQSFFCGDIMYQELKRI